MEERRGGGGVERERDDRLKKRKGYLEQNNSEK